MIDVEEVAAAAGSPLRAGMDAAVIVALEVSLPPEDSVTSPSDGDNRLRRLELTYTVQVYVEGPTKRDRFDARKFRRMEVTTSRGGKNSDRVLSWMEAWARMWLHMRHRPK